MLSSDPEIPMTHLRQQAIAAGWLNAGDRPLFPRLAFPLACTSDSCVHEFNRATRDQVLAELLGGTARPAANPSFLGKEQEVVIAETDRYGLPLRTVLGASTGLMRSDPYYDQAYLARFYSQHYRNLYRPGRFSHSWFFAEQVRHGQRVLDANWHRLPTGGGRVLDIGCGMGGTLLPFAFAGWTAIGCDYGDAYAARGRSLNLDVRTGGVETVSAEKPFDLIILSHVLEHCPDPVAVAQSAAALLADTGVCYIEVPGLLNLETHYEGDVLNYLQNAHLWHFTGATLAATLARGGLAVESCTQAVQCIARRGPTVPHASAADGPQVMEQLQRLERAAAKLTAA
jgi:SAM-dependent methyltransferase